MPSYSETRILGHAGRDAESMTAQNGNLYCKFSVAVSRGKDMPTDWFNVVAFGKTAEIAQENVRKGALVEVYGRMQSNKHEDKVYWDLIAQRVYTFTPKEAVPTVMAAGTVQFTDDELVPF